jgi:hypothetical protein
MFLLTNRQLNPFVFCAVQALPRQSLYFTNYTMFAVTGNFIFGFFRFYPMARRHFKRQRATTPQEVRCLGVE